jgi:hypothetical protein
LNQDNDSESQQGEKPTHAEDVPIVPDRPDRLPVERVTYDISEDDPKKHKWVDRRMVSLTAGLVFFALASVIVGIFQWCAINGQLGEMRAAGHQTDQMLDLLHQQVGQITKLSTDTHELATQAKIQSESTQNIAKANLAQLADLEDRERAIVDTKLKLVQEPNVLTCEIKNSGPTAAETVLYNLVPYEAPVNARKGFIPPQRLLNSMISPVYKSGGFSLGKGESRAIPLNNLPLNKEAMKDKMHFTFIDVKYSDIFGKNHYAYDCIVYLPRFGRYMHCDEWGLKNPHES